MCDEANIIKENWGAAEAPRPTKRILHMSVWYRAQHVTSCYIHRAPLSLRTSECVRLFHFSSKSNRIMKLIGKHTHSTFGECCTKDSNIHFFNPSILNLPWTWIMCAMWLLWPSHAALKFTFYHHSFPSFQPNLPDLFNPTWFYHILCFTAAENLDTEP